MRRMGVLAALFAVFSGHTAAAARPPVVMVAFDELATDALLTPGGEIDATRFPGFAALARVSTWYPNATTVHDESVRAVPAILEGRLRRDGPPFRWSRHRRNVFRLLRDRGWRLRVREESTDVCDGLPGCDSLIRRRFWQIAETDRIGRFRRTIRSISRRRPGTFWFHDVVLPHGPLVYLPDGRLYRSPRSTWDPATVPEHEPRYLLQLAAIDGLVGKLLARLRREGMLRRALLVVTADHGTAFRGGDVRELSPENIDEIAPVPLFVKAPGQLRGRVDRSLIRTVDVLPTIARLLHLPLRWRVDGRPAGSAAVRSRRSVAIEARRFDRVYSISPAELAERRRQNRIARAGALGTGSWARLFRFGDDRGLVGRRLADLAPQPADAESPTARLVTGQAMRSLKRRASIWPCWVSGVLSGGGGARRELAVAVNSRVEAIARSDRDAQGRETFSAVVPWQALRAGANRLEVLEVRGDGRLVRLAGGG